MFVNHGWSPEQLDNESDESKILMIHMMLKELKSRPKPKGQNKLIVSPEATGIGQKGKGW